MYWEHMEGRMEVAKGLGWVASVLLQCDKGFIHGHSVGHVEMPQAMKQTAGGEHILEE